MNSTEKFLWAAVAFLVIGVLFLAAGLDTTRSEVEDLAGYFDGHEHGRRVEEITSLEERVELLEGRLDVCEGNIHNLYDEVEWLNSEGSITYNDYFRLQKQDAFFMGEINDIRQMICIDHPEAYWFCGVPEDE